MTEPGRDRLSVLFARARRLDGADRRRFLERHCKDDPGLRDEIESLLRFDAASPRFLDTGELRKRAPVAGSPPVPESIGPYRVTGVLGEGGMGVVYSAEQGPPLDRRVALKVVRTELLSPGLVARFEHEQQVLARLAHPGIARVYEAGRTHAGLPYFAMEFVDGPPIVEYCRRRDLGVPALLRLFGQVCAAVEHAHRNAVIHRDLKSANILVEERRGRAAPKIIDFGVAKVAALGAARTAAGTLAGQLVGTLEYMSPEQLAGDGDAVDTRTDVYALGVLLYELLTGAVPFPRADDESLDDLRRRIRSRRPTPPSEVTGRRDLRGDLDRIVARALERDPRDRYPSARDLAADVTAYLEGRPVTATDRGPLYLAGKFVRRHRVGVAAGAVIVSLLAGLVIATVLQARSAARSAEETRAVTATLLGLLTIDDRLDIRWGGRMSAGEILDHGFARIDDTSTDGVVRARALALLADLQRRARGGEQARPILAEAVARMSAALGPDHPETLDARRSLALAIRDTGAFADAVEILADVRDRQARSLGPDHPDTLATALQLGYARKLGGDADGAAAEFSRLVEALTRRLGPDHPETLLARALRAGVELDRGRHAEARAELEVLIEPMGRELGPRHFETLAAVYNLGCAHANLGNPDRALELLATAIDAGFSTGRPLDMDPLVAPLRHVEGYERLVAAAELNRADARQALLRRAAGLVAERRYDEALHLVAPVRDALARVEGLDAPATLGAAYTQAELLLYLGREDESEALARDAMPRLDPDGIVHADFVWLLAEIDVRRGEVGSALRRYERVIDRYRRTDIAFSPFDEFAAACAAALRGDDDVLDRLEDASDRGFARVDWLDQARVLEPYRADERFRAVVDRALRRQWLAPAVGAAVEPLRQRPDEELVDGDGVERRASEGSVGVHDSEQHRARQR